MTKNNQNSKLKIQNLCQQGFTLLELLIYIAILAIISSVVAQAFLTFNRGRGQVESRVEVNNNMRFGLERIKRDLTASTTLITPSAAGNSSSTLVLNHGSSDITYCVAANRLRRQVGGPCNDASEAITSNKVRVDSIHFSRHQVSNAVLNKKNDSVQIYIQMSYDSISPDWQFRQVGRLAINLRQDF